MNKIEEQRALLDQATKNPSPEFSTGEYEIQMSAEEYALHLAMHAHYALLLEIAEAVSLLIQAVDIMQDGPDESDEAMAQQKYTDGYRVAKQALNQLNLRNDAGAEEK